MQFEVLTDIGKKRTVNEDCAAVFTLSNGILLAVIADGMGGHRGGGYASATAIRVIGESFLKLDGQHFTKEEEWAEWLREAVLHVNRLLYTESTVDEELKGMGTTLEVALIRENSCLISHTGDSRVYSISKDEICQITRDHSYVNVLLESGEITEEEAETHPKRNWIMRAIGSEKSIEADLYSLELPVDNYLLLCTDGLSNKVNVEQIKEIVISSADLREKAKRLVDLANTLGGEDNISVILIDPAGSEVTPI